MRAALAARLARLDDVHLDGHQESDMSVRERSVSVAEAKAHLSELLKAVEAGETILITRRGHAVASLSPVRRAPAPVDIAWLRDATSRMEYSPVSGTDVVREMRDARY